ncbi:MAG: hypothetical protein FJZ01_21690, partial [Candidatus Sericytochromatia bacterium]|nr:hypothetical protein [Candidatus Tanganyikabacteria bacterium]
MPWLPPWVILAAHVAHGLSWSVLLGLFATGQGAASFAAFAWPHLAGLAWLTTLSLGVLCHVIPGFLDVRIPAERFARAMMLVTWLGGLLLAAGFWWGRADLLPWAGTVAMAGLVGAGVPLAIGIASPPAEPDPDPAPLVPAFLFVLCALLVAAGLGTYLAAALAGKAFLSFPLAAVAAGHAHLAVGGWLTLLVMGVSTRTLRRILGAPPAARHGLVSALLSVGALLLGFAWLAPWPLAAQAGAAFAGAGALLYAFDTG